MTANYLTQAINGSVRIAFVILPSIKAATYVSELASRALNAALNVIGVKLQMPELATGKETDTYAMKAYTYVHKFLPASITSKVDAYKDLTSTDVAKGAAFYTATAIVSTFVLNKLVGPMPEVYNNVMKYSGNALRLDTGYDVVQLAFNYVTKK